MRSRIVMGLAFGDEGKGTVVDHLTATSESRPLVVRFSGGAQAAHNVITETGLHHTFSQFGAGTLRRAQTLLSRYVLVDPLRLHAEGLRLSELLGEDALALVAVDVRAPLVTRIHQAINHKRERARGDARHGSTGLGMGETELYRLLAPFDYPTVGDLGQPRELARKLALLHAWGEAQVGALAVDLASVIQELQSFGVDRVLQLLQPREVNELIAGTQELIFEGSQGILLDEWVGFHPHTTWSTLTPHNALSLLREAGRRDEAERIGVTRSYTTRHGAGPFPSEAPQLPYGEAHNGYGEFQGSWRVGHLDLTLLKYAAEIVRPTSLAITHMDVEQAHVAARYDNELPFHENVTRKADKEWQASFTAQLAALRPKLTPVASMTEVKQLIEEATAAPARLLSYGPESSAKRDA